MRLLADDHERRFLVPDDVELSPGPLKVDQFAGEPMSVLEAEVLPYLCTEEDAASHMAQLTNAALEAALPSIEAFASVFAPAGSPSCRELIESVLSDLTAQSRPTGRPVSGPTAILTHAHADSRPPHPNLWACRRDKMAFRERELAEPMPSFSLDVHERLAQVQRALALDRPSSGTLT